MLNWRKNLIELLRSKMGEFNLGEVKRQLDRLCAKYETTDFIENDPISIPHRFTKREDIEIAGFLAAAIAWGNRKIILRNGHRIADLMDCDPFNFVMGASDKELSRADGFVHRTFNDLDLKYFILSLRNIYENHGGLRSTFEGEFVKTRDMRVVLENFYTVFFELPVESRTKRHISSIAKGSACKRLNMFLRWMVRGGEVDFGLWGEIPTSKLYLPLDIHSGNVSRKLGLLTRNANDFKAVEQVTANLQTLNSVDPIKYDFALFSAGIEKQL